MDYQDGRNLYWTALGTATIAARIIWRPWAGYIVAMIGTMISDPGKMSASADAWRTTEQGGTTVELTKLKEELANLKGLLAEHWEGAAFEQFTKAHEDFTKSLETLEASRNSTGEAVDQTARVYYWGAVTFAAIGTLMLAYAMILLAFTRAAPGASAMLDIKVGKKAVSMGKNVLIKHGIAVGVITGLMYQAVKMTEASGQAFPMVKGIPTEIDSMKAGAPEFTNTMIEYDKDSGELLPKTDSASLPGDLRL